MAMPQPSATVIKTVDLFEALIEGEEPLYYSERKMGQDDTGRTETYYVTAFDAVEFTIQEGVKFALMTGNGETPSYYHAKIHGVDVHLVRGLAPWSGAEALTMEIRLRKWYLINRDSMANYAFVVELSESPAPYPTCGVLHIERTDPQRRNVGTRLWENRGGRIRLEMPESPPGSGPRY